MLTGVCISSANSQLSCRISDTFRGDGAKLFSSLELSLSLAVLACIFFCISRCQTTHALRATPRFGVCDSIDADVPDFANHGEGGPGSTRRPLLIVKKAKPEKPSLQMELWRRGRKRFSKKVDAVIDGLTSNDREWPS